MTPGQKAALAVYFASVAGSVVFVVGRLLSRFWRYPEGIALLVQHLALVGLGGQIIYVLARGGDQLWQIPIYIVLQATFTGAVWSLTYLQEKGRRQARAVPTPSPETHPPLEDHQLG